MFREIRSSEKITDKDSRRNRELLFDIDKPIDITKLPNKWWLVVDNTFDIDKPIREYGKASIIRSNDDPTNEDITVINVFDSREAAEEAESIYNKLRKENHDE